MGTSWRRILLYIFIGGLWFFVHSWVKSILRPSVQFTNMSSSLMTATVLGEVILDAPLYLLLLTNPSALLESRVLLSDPKAVSRAAAEASEAVAAAVVAGPSATAASATAALGRKPATS